VSAEALPLLTPRARQSGGPCQPFVEPDLSAAEAAEMAVMIKALADPTRLQIVDALRKAAPEAVCQCELTPLFAMSQQALSKHLKVLILAKILGSERRAVWTYYFVLPGALERIHAWLS
jgi:ArsR family transcriptional regulator